MPNAVRIHLQAHAARCRTQVRVTATGDHAHAAWTTLSHAAKVRQKVPRVVAETGWVPVSLWIKSSAKQALAVSPARLGGGTLIPHYLRVRLKACAPGPKSKPTYSLNPVPTAVPGRTAPGHGTAGGRPPTRPRMMSAERAPTLPTAALNPCATPRISVGNSSDAWTCTSHVHQSLGQKQRWTEPSNCNSSEAGATLLSGQTHIG